MLTNDYIEDRLKNLAAERRVNIRYALESGSRAWGLASTDSDYDVRFIYQHPKDWYLRLDRPKDMIGPLLELEGELDMAGWDLRKVMGHLVGSNAGVIEWLHSPTVYQLDEDFLNRLRTLATIYFQPAKVMAHYLGIARSAKQAGFDEARQDWNLKKFFYYVRPLLAADYVYRERINPPVAFIELVELLEDEAVLALLHVLIDYKSKVDEKHRVVISEVLMDYFFQQEVTLRAKLDDVPRRIVDRAEADALFRDLIGY